MSKTADTILIKSYRYFNQLSVWNLEDRIPEALITDKQALLNDILALIPMPEHRDDCHATVDWLMQRGQYKDPIECFEDRCVCGAVEIRELRQRIRQYFGQDNQGESND